MKIKTVLSATVAATILALNIAPAAMAKTSITKGVAVCKKAIQALQPAPKSVRADADATQVSNDRLLITFRVKNADDTQAKLVCTVDRETDTPTVATAG